MKIGILTEGYPNKRNINYLTHNKYIRINSLNKTVYYKKFGFSDGCSYNGFFFELLFYDVAHFFNTISLSKAPWITTFETAVPFYNKEISEYLYADFDINAVRNYKKLEEGLKCCASNSCKALIAISKCTQDIQLKLVANFPQYEDAIKLKLIQLYPPQELLINSVEEKSQYVDEKLTFIFVGREFYRKGGLAILRCFEKLSLKYDFNLIIVSNLNNDIPHIFTKKDEQEAKYLIKKYNGNWLKYYESLRNEQVLDLMKRSHIGLLPTYSDTFGYSVLEFQAAGCPVISSDIRALPEINNNKCGWLMNIGEKTKHGEIKNLGFVLKNQEMERKMFDLISLILTTGFVEKEKIDFCIQRIKENHSLEEYEKTLSNIYKEVAK